LSVCALLTCGSVTHTAIDIDTDIKQIKREKHAPRLLQMQRQTSTQIDIQTDTDIDIDTDTQT